jgi:protein SCO1/2
MRQRLLLALTAGSLLVVILALVGVIWHRIAASALPQLEGTAVQTSVAEPGAVLVDQDGRAFRLAEQRGKELVLFFGYAHCPDICPTTLANLARADRMLGAQAKDVTVAFVTVDPARDALPLLKKYVALFNPSFFGLTGAPSALQDFYRAYRVWFQRLPNHGSSAGYLMAHSSAIYMLDPEGRLRVIHDWSDSPAALAHDMKALLE